MPDPAPTTTPAPGYGTNPQTAVNNMCIAITKAERDLVTAMISCGALPDAINDFRQAIGKSFFMMGNDVQGAGSGTETVTTFFRQAADAMLSEGFGMDKLRLLHCELEAFRVRCKLPPPDLVSAGGGKG